MSCFHQKRKVCWKKLLHHATLPQIWNVCRTSPDVVTWAVDYLFSLLTVNIFSPSILPRLVWLKDVGVCHSSMLNHTENHLGLHSEWWESRPCCTLVLRDTQSPWGAGIQACGEGYEMPHGRLVRGVGCMESVRLGGCCVQTPMLKDQWRADKVGQNEWLGYVATAKFSMSVYLFPILIQLLYFLYLTACSP